LSRQPPSSERGFTILECEIALLVLTLAVILTMKMIAAQDVLMQSMDSWLEGDAPTYYIAKRESDYERWLEYLADLSPTEPGASSWSPPLDPAYRVSILSNTKQLDPPTISVLVELRSL
jgi:hypothetical protein